MVDKSFVADGAVVIDVGINVDEDGNLCGDVDFEDVLQELMLLPNLLLQEPV